MCFSPEVSFTLSGALAVGGTYCVHQARKIDRKFLPLAAVPIVFGVQQFGEGCVWTGIARGDARLTTIAGIAFLFFALWFWPIWIPLCTLFVERSRKTKLFLLAMTALGALIGVLLFVPTALAPSWLLVGVDHHSLRYNIDPSPIFHAIPGAVWQAGYIAAVATPLFVSSEHKLVHAGVAIVLSAAITRVFFDYAFASVWCFFAAALSLYVCFVFYTLRPRRAIAP